MEIINYYCGLLKPVYNLYVAYILYSMVYPKVGILETVLEGVLLWHKNYKVTPESSYLPEKYLFLANFSLISGQSKSIQ